MIWLRPLPHSTRPKSNPTLVGEDHRSGDPRHLPEVRCDNLVSLAARQVTGIEIRRQFSDPSAKASRLQNAATQNHLFDRCRREQRVACLREVMRDEFVRGADNSGPFPDALRHGRSGHR